MPKYSLEIQQALARVLQVKTAHEGELLKLPGVHAVSLEPKITGGKRIPEFAIVVHVEKKKAPAELQPDEAIPSVIDGVKTDVIESAPLRTSAAPSTDTDDKHYPHVIGGAEIVADGMTIVSGGAAQVGGGVQVTISRAKGTLGCVAINQAATDPSKKAVALTNAHVLLDVALTTTHDNAAVGQPDTSSSCCKSCDNTIGHTDQDVVLIGAAAPEPPNPPTGVDAGFVTLASETEWSAEVILSGAGDSITKEQIAGPHMVDDSEALFDASMKPIYAVHKRGIRTQATTGWLTSIHLTTQIPYTSMDGKTVKELFMGNTLKVDPQDPAKFFALEGDSGSALVNADHKVVGLVFGVPPDTAPPSSAISVCAIGEVQTRLNVVVADTATFPGVQKVPKPASAHAFADLPAERSVLRARMQEARQELERTKIGTELDHALHQHFTEIRYLVNRNKRAAVVWRRIQGPAWVNEVFSCLLDRHRPLPSQLGGQSLSSCLGRLTAVLMRYGSEPLRQDLSRFGPMVLELAGRTYDEALNTLRLQPAG